MKIFRRKGHSSFYYYRIYSGGGEKLYCTYETNREKAQQKANEHQVVEKGGLSTEQIFKILLARLEEMPKEDRDRSRSDFGNRLLRLQDEKLPFDEAWDRWIKLPNKSKHGNPSENTLRSYSAIWKRIGHWAMQQNIVHLHDMTPKQAEEYMADLWASGITERTYCAHLKFLRMAFNTLRRQAGIVENPFKDIPAMELQTVSREAFTAEELKTICSKASGDWKYMIAIGLFTGLRLTDVVHLKWSDITDRITVAPAKVKRRKGSKAKIEIPIHEALVGLLDDLRRVRGGSPSGYLFPKIVAQYDKSAPSISLEFRNFLRDECNISTTAGADEESPRKRRACAKGFHSLRHSFVSLCAASGVPQATTQKLVGHASPAMTQLYSHATKEQERKAINLLPADFFTKPGM